MRPQRTEIPSHFFVLILVIVGIFDKMVLNTRSVEIEPLDPHHFLSDVLFREAIRQLRCNLRHLAGVKTGELGFDNIAAAVKDISIESW